MSDGYDGSSGGRHDRRDARRRYEANRFLLAMADDGRLGLFLVIHRRATLSLFLANGNLLHKSAEG